jgi:hypothetical protein
MRWCVSPRRHADRCGRAGNERDLVSQIHDDPQSGRGGLCDPDWTRGGRPVTPAGSGRVRRDQLTGIGIRRSYSAVRAPSCRARPSGGRPLHADG